MSASVRAKSNMGTTRKLKKVKLKGGKKNLVVVMEQKRERRKSRSN